MIAEPMTLATDYALAAANALFGFRLLRAENLPRRLWGFGFLALSVSALVGGSFHGFAPMLSGAASAVLWEITELAVGTASFLLLIAVVDLYTTRGLRKALRAFAAAKYVVYVAWMATHDEYRFVIYDTGLTLAIMILLSLAALRLWHHSAAKWLLGGVAVSIVAAIAQSSGIRLHTHFNHNDLYHVIQLIAMYLLYRGGLLFGVALECRAR
ncbi:MAG: DUF6962 family protein [Burkholderiales bacterium]